ncbi:hypothetical protein KC349_g279 [Hortaea werneckii]|nr:hypothetical protein KC349_g279 [Hortaea werneckii]
MSHLPCIGQKRIPNQYQLSHNAEEIQMRPHRSRLSCPCREGQTLVHTVHAAANVARAFLRNAAIKGGERLCLAARRPTEPDPSTPASEPSVPVTDPRGPRVLTEAGDGNMASVPSRLLGTSSVGGDIQPLTRASLASCSFHAIAFSTRVRLFSVTLLRKSGSVVSVRKVSLRILAYAGEAPWRTRSSVLLLLVGGASLHVPCHRCWKVCRRATRRVAILPDPLPGRHSAGLSVKTGRAQSRVLVLYLRSPLLQIDYVYDLFARLWRAITWIVGTATAARYRRTGRISPTVFAVVRVHYLRRRFRMQTKARHLEAIESFGSCGAIQPFQRDRSVSIDPRSSPVPSDDSPSEIHVTVIETIHAELVCVSLASVSAPSSLTRVSVTPGPTLKTTVVEIGQAMVWIRDAVDLESDKHAFRPLGDWRSDKGMRPGSC